MLKVRIKRLRSVEFTLFGTDDYHTVVHYETKVFVAAGQSSRITGRHERGCCFRIKRPICQTVKTTSTPSITERNYT